MRYLLFSLTLIGLISSCRNYDQNAFNNPVTYNKTVKRLNNVVLENNFPPMIASRNYVYANIAAYEVVVAFNSKYKTLAGQIKHLPKLNYGDTANVNYRLAALLAFCKVGEAVTFPEGSLQEHISELKNQADSMGMSRKMLNASVAFADSLANQILRWSKTDNYAQLRTAPRYNVTQEEGRWVPTAPMYATALEPHWKKMRPMILDSASECRPVPPIVYDVKNKNSKYYKALLEVKSIADSLTDEQKHIAFFWDDNPFTMNVTGHVMYATKKFSPPGHWMNIVGIASQKSGADFDKTVAAFVQTSIALYDAFISCWDEKFRSNYVRPQTIIEKLLQPDWQPLIQTPPFPSYTSGHATASAAAAEVMTYHFGNELSFTDTSLLEFGIKSRVIKNFREAAQEAAMSRLYGGIHYRFDNEAGNEAGTRLGKLVVSRISTNK